MRLAGFTLISLAFVLTSFAQADTVTISKSIPFADDSGVTDAIRDECEFDTRVPEYIKKESKRSVDVVLSDKPLEEAGGKVLFLEVSNIFGLGGGVFSGSKSAIVSGELKENGEVIGSMSVRRHSIMGMMPGTCSILKRISKAIGEDVAEWLKEPTMGAELGDLEDDDDEGEVEDESSES